MDETSFKHIYFCPVCKVEVAIVHPDDFAYMDECPECGTDDLEWRDTVMVKADD